MQMLTWISHCMFAESPFLQTVEHVFSFSVVLDFPFTTMVHRTIKLAWYHVYKLVKTHLQDAQLGRSHQDSFEGKDSDSLQELGDVTSFSSREY